MDLNNAAAVCHRHFKLVAIDLNTFTTRWQMAEALHHQTADGIHLFVAEMGIEDLVKVFDRCQCPNGVGVAAQLTMIPVCCCPSQ